MKRLLGLILAHSRPFGQLQRVALSRCEPNVLVCVGSGSQEVKDGVFVVSKKQVALKINEQA